MMGIRVLAGLQTFLQLSFLNVIFLVFEFLFVHSYNVFMYIHATLSQESFIKV
jgi:hypothetical protein